MPSSRPQSSIGRSRFRTRAHILGELLQLPLLGERLLGNAARDHGLDDLGAHLRDGLRHIGRLHELAALRVDLAALVVHDVVVFQHVLAGVEVARLDLLLRLLQRLVDPGMDDRLALLEAEPLQHSAHPVGAEDAHQIVFERQEEARAARIALTAGPAAELVVDAPALVPLGADHEQSARLLHRLMRRGDLVADLGLARGAQARVLDAAPAPS